MDKTKLDQVDILGRKIEAVLKSYQSLKVSKQKMENRLKAAEKELQEIRQKNHFHEEEKRRMHTALDEILTRVDRFMPE